MSNSNTENVMKSPFSHYVGRLLGMQIYTTFLTLIPFTIASALLDVGAASFITALFGIVVYCITIYTASWATGERDRNLVLYGHMHEDKLRGLKAGLCAVCPMLICTLLLIFNVYASFLPNWFLVCYRLIFLPFAFIVNWMTAHPALAFLGILVCAVCPAAAAYGYYNGRNLNQVLPKILYKQKPRNINNCHHLIHNF